MNLSFFWSYDGYDLDLAQSSENDKFSFSLLRVTGSSDDCNSKLWSIILISESFLIELSTEL